MDRTLLYYDGPRLLLQRTLSGQLYLAWWNDADESIERWVYLPLSERRLHEVLTGEMPDLDALQNPEDGHIFVVDVDMDSDAVLQTIMTDADALPADTLPSPNVRLNIPVPAEVGGIPNR